jgi:hypothetical protein
LHKMNECVKKSQNLTFIVNFYVKNDLYLSDLKKKIKNTSLGADFLLELCFLRRSLL